MRTPREYRKKTRVTKKVVLPSGLECEIRAVPSMQLMNLTVKAEKEGIDLEQWLREHVNEALNVILPSSVVEPKILPARKAGEETIEPDDALFIDELVMSDLNTLFLEIVKMSGVEEEVLQEYESFPDLKGRSEHSDDGQGIQL